MSRTDLQTYLHELLMKQDQMSMAASIESRVPFLDDRLVEHVAALPSASQGAHVADQGDLPRGGARHHSARDSDAQEDGISGARSAAGCATISGRSSRSSCSARARRARGLFDRGVAARMADEHASGRGTHGDRLWLLVNLEIWQRIFCDGEDPRVMRCIARSMTAYANPLGQDGRAVAVNDWRASAKPADRVGAVPAS